MYESQQHEMRLETTHPSGAEEWYCPVCGRRFLIQWPPAYKKIVLEPGDEYAYHLGGKGGVRLEPLQATQGEEAAFLEDWRPGNAELRGADPAESEEAKLTDALRPWVKWLEDINFDI